MSEFEVEWLHYLWRHIMTDNDPLFLLPEDQRNHVISAARGLMHKLDLPNDAYNEVFELVRKCAIIKADTDRRLAKMQEAGVQPERVASSQMDLEAMTKSIFGLK